VVFDPFHDFEVAGYLRNVHGNKSAVLVKHHEHNHFRANVGTALAYLAGRAELTYQEFLEVHRILFQDYYPWAGQDRAAVLPHSAVRKAHVLFAHPQDARRAVEHGLRLGQDAPTMLARPGEVMGLFAYGHPFLDGNGRTMLLVHMELCHRAGFALEWHKTHKADYLAALAQEINAPGQGILDAYLRPFTGPQLAREAWGDNILTVKGLDGLDGENQLDGNLDDPAVAQRYRQLEERRAYAYTAAVPAQAPIQRADGSSP